MATTFHEAREALRVHLTALWGAGADEVAPYGFEDSVGYLLVVESPVAVLGGPSYVVDRLTGTVSEVSYLDNFERFGTMTPTCTTRPEWVALSPTGPYVRAGVQLSPEELAEALAVPDGADA